MVPADPLKRLLHPHMSNQNIQSFLYTVWFWRIKFCSCILAVFTDIGEVNTHHTSAERCSVSNVTHESDWCTTSELNWNGQLFLGTLGLFTSSLPPFHPNLHAQILHKHGPPLHSALIQCLPQHRVAREARFPAEFYMMALKRDRTLVDTLVM